MNKSRHNWLLAVLTHVYRLLLFCYPKPFRESFGPEMIDVFTRRCQSAVMDPSLTGLARVAVAGFVDLIATASAERVDVVAARRPTFRTYIEASVLDARYAIRTITKRPGLLALTLFTLTLAIGGATAVFSIVNAAILRPLPFRDPDKLVTLWELLAQGTSFGAMAGIGVAPLDYFDWKAQNHVFSEMALIGVSAPIFSAAGRSRQLEAERVSEEFFTLLGLRPEAGRSFRGEDFGSAAQSVVIVSHEFWQQFLGTSDGALGATLKLDGQIATVIGIMPGDLRLPTLWGRSNEKPDIWIPLRLKNGELNSRRDYAFRPIARLKAGVTLRQADAEMAVIAARLSVQYPQTNAGMGIGIVPLQDQLFQELRPALFLLLAATGFVLLIACVNVANLQLVRTSGRRREFAIRTAVGAGRGSLIRQLLIDSLILALASGICGLLLARWVIPVALALIPPDSLMPRLENVPIDRRILAFSFLISGLTALLCGFVPALRVSRADVGDSLKESGRTGSDGRRTHRLANVFVISEMALALVLVVGAGVLIQSFRRLDRIDSGFRAKGLLTLDVPIPQYKYKDDLSRIRLFQEILERAKAIPGVESASLASDFPESNIVDCIVEGRIVESRATIPQVAFRAISPGFFETLHIPLREGRSFNEADTSDRPLAAVISERMAANLWPAGRAINKRFRLESDKEWITVVGVAGDIRRKTADRSLPEYYVPYTQVAPWYAMRLILRTEGNPLLTAPFVRSAIWSYDRDLPIRDVGTLEDIVDREAWRQRLSASLMGLFAAIALLLASAGIYGVMSNVVAQRKNEMGIRIALGAQPREVRGMVIKAGLQLALCGVATGLVIVFGLTRVLASYLYGFSAGDAGRIAVARQIEPSSGFLYGISATDPLTLAAVSLALIAVALTACYLPALRATRVDPLLALRSE